MTKLESPTSRELVRLLRERLPNGVTFKHCDMVTRAIPDISVTHAAHTIWVEAKYIDDATKIKPCQLERTSTIRGDDLFIDSCGRFCVEVVPLHDVDGAQWEVLRKMGNGYLVVYTVAGAAFTHINGFRASVGSMRLRLFPLERVARQIVDTVKRREE